MFSKRKSLYEQIERKRDSHVILYVTGDRGNLQTQIGNDALPLFVNHLDKIEGAEKITLILYTQGGNTLTSWTLVKLIRNFCRELEVIVPFRCHSAGTLICLGADPIIMTKQATLGPIDPSMGNPFNPLPKGRPVQGNLPVSVEHINAYLDMIKNDLKIYDQGHLTELFISLSQQIHPLVLGQFYRTKEQIQMIARKLLSYQQLSDEKMEKIIDFLCSKSGSHDYTIDRNEARDELGLNIVKPDKELYALIQGVYKDFESELELINPFNPGVYVKKSREYSFRRALIESIRGQSDVFVTKGFLEENKIVKNQMIPLFDNKQGEGWVHEA